jgi:uncharacterized protein YerC
MSGRKYKRLTKKEQAQLKKDEANTIVEEAQQPNVLPVQEPTLEAELEALTKDELEAILEHDKKENKHICMLCDEDLLDGDKKMEYECGCHIVHTRCGLQQAYFSMRNHGNFTCGECGIILFGDATELAADDENIIMINNIETLKNNKNFKADLKKVKMKSSEHKRAATAYNKRMNEEFTKFHNLVYVSIMSVTLAKREALKALKQTDEYKNFSKAAASSAATLTRFKRKYNLGWRESGMLKLRPYSGWRWRLGLPSRMTGRRFRIRI